MLDTIYSRCYILNARKKDGNEKARLAGGPAAQSHGTIARQILRVIIVYTFLRVRRTILLAELPKAEEFGFRFFYFGVLKRI